MTLPRIFFTRGGSEFGAYPLPSIRPAPHTECQRFISYQSERYTSRGLLSPFHVDLAVILMHVRTSFR
jgi:hypothetical protein